VVGGTSVAGHLLASVTRGGCEKARVAIGFLTAIAWRSSSDKRRPLVMCRCAQPGDRREREASSRKGEPLDQLNFTVGPKKHAFR
jgi:hypothetical protein